MEKYDYLEIGVHLHSRPEEAAARILAAYDAGFEHLIHAPQIAVRVFQTPSRDGIQHRARHRRLLLNLSLPAVILMLRKNAEIRMPYERHPADGREQYALRSPRSTLIGFSVLRNQPFTAAT